jgi:DNA-binding transcriptional LysR family regulator
MLTPYDLELFVALADTGSLTAAARVCGLTRATIARRLTTLEERLGVPLVHRTTREFSLTEAGNVFLEGCRDTLTRLRSAEAAVHQLNGKPRGPLRIACPIIRIEQIIGPLTVAFAAAYPEVDVQVHLSSEPCNPLADGFDLAVQIGFEQHAALMARCLLREPYLLVASPDYLARRGLPRAVEELATHDCIVSVRANGVHEPWPLADGGAFNVARPKLLANAAGLIRIAALAGMGVALMAKSLMNADLASGRLVPLLEDEVGQVVPVSLVYAAGAQQSPKIRSFVDFAVTWVERLGPDGATPNPTVSPVAALAARSADATPSPTRTAT